MNREGKHLDTDKRREEFQKVLELVASGSTLQNTKKEFRKFYKRHPTTIARRYHVACALFQSNLVQLTHDEAQEIADSIGYGITAQYVLDAFFQYRVWSQRGRTPLVEQVRRQKLIEHLNTIREQINDLKSCLPFWHPENLYGWTYLPAIVEVRLGMKSSGGIIVKMATACVS